MKLELKVYDALCECEVFKINDINADYNDFGEKQDTLPFSAVSYMCENMQFTPKPAVQSVLTKYKISGEEYNEICDKLQELLSFGRCGWCV